MPDGNLIWFQQVNQFWPIMSTFSATVQSERHSVINHCDRYITVIYHTMSLWLYCSWEIAHYKKNNVLMPDGNLIWFQQVNQFWPISVFCLETSTAINFKTNPNFYSVHQIKKTEIGQNWLTCWNHIRLPSGISTLFLLYT
jgi:hypothetical protein